MNSDRDTLAGGLPHSEIPGSPIARISPGLFAACHVLHRLSVPRHPPDALTSRLITGVSPRGRTTGSAGKRRTPPSRTGPKLHPRKGGDPYAAASHEDTSSDSSGTSLARAARQAKLRFAKRRPCGPSLSASVTSQLSLFTLQSTSASQSELQRCSLFANTGGAARRSPAAPVVEVNGFEPMTSCLQSRRSPS
jgi:hypothetical protein